MHKAVGELTAFLFLSLSANDDNKTGKLKLR